MGVEQQSFEHKDQRKMHGLFPIVHRIFMVKIA
jgi:hypothetical protein